MISHEELASYGESSLDKTQVCAVPRFIPSLSETAFADKIHSVKKYIQQGDTYQINYTFPFYSRFYGSPLAWFTKKTRSHHGSFAAYIETQSARICSLSPELFFTRTAAENADECRCACTGSAGVNQANGAGHSTGRDGAQGRMFRITCRPMKGTMKRRPGFEKEDEAALHCGKKNRAENLMITDMIRNDLSRIALDGTVEVPKLYTVETYETVHQMTSSVQCLSKSTLADIFTALFPCASITGAPKTHSMHIIQELEGSPRGIYTGAAGLVRPDSTAVFSVAIRTAVFPAPARQVARGKSATYGLPPAEYRTGAGITWLSDASEEYRECLLKAEAAHGEQDFYLYETMLYENGNVYLAERHMNRLARGASYFGIIRSDGRSAASVIQQDGIAILNGFIQTSVSHRGPQRIRMMLAPDGTITCEVTGISPLPSHYTAAVMEPGSGDSVIIHSSNCFLYHKTSLRVWHEKALEQARIKHPGCTDCILVNERGEITESTRANVVLVKNGVHTTPPLPSGLLGGVYREELLAQGVLREHICTVQDVYSADEVYFINSLRRKIPVVIL